MVLKFVYGGLPAFILRNNLVPKGFNGITLGFVVNLRPHVYDSVEYWAQALVEHELVHVRQFYRSLGLFPFLYLLHPASRMKYECEAYSVQIRMLGDDAMRSAIGRLAENYRLPFSPAAIERCLRTYVRGREPARS
jgi:hypothetical protein